MKKETWQTTLNMRFKEQHRISRNIFILVQVGVVENWKKKYLIGPRYILHMSVEDQLAGYVTMSYSPLNQLDISLVAASKFRNTSWLRQRKLESFQIFFSIRDLQNSLMLMTFEGRATSLGATPCVGCGWILTSPLRPDVIIIYLPSWVGSSPTHLCIWCTANQMLTH